MIIDCISDLHGHYPKLEGGDLLIVAGDLTAMDSWEEYLHFGVWLDDQKYRKKIVISGNHDNCFQGATQMRLKTFFAPFSDYLCDSGTEFEYSEPVRNIFDPHDKSIVYKKKLKIWGSPWTRSFEDMNPNCKAFTYDDEEFALEKFNMIPADTDILITHSPPFTIHDMTTDGRQVGSPMLISHLLNRVKPRLHVFGHIHEAYGQTKYWNTTIFVNASHVNERYEPVNKPVRIIL